MKRLSREASAALSALKANDPTATDEARVRKNLERALGVGIPVATVAAATTAQAASVAALSVGAKAIVFVLAVVVASVMTVKIANSRSAGESAPPIAKPVQVVAPVALVQATPAPTPASPVAADEVKPVAPVRARALPSPVVIAPTPTAEPHAEPEVIATPPPPPITEATIELEVEANFPGCDGATELRSAVSARKLLNADRPEEAVWLLGAYQRRCPSGRWSDEAWTVRMAGLCRLGRNSEVTGLLQWFSAEYPQRRATVMSELRSFCSAEVLRHGEASGD